MFNSQMLKSFVLDLLFPNRCPLCGNVINWKIECCSKCIDELPYTGDELCHKCGKPFENCSCNDNDWIFSRCYAAFYYDGSARGGVIYLKSTKNTLFPRLFAEKIYKDICSDLYSFKADCIVPVPMAKIKLRRRGYNQAKVLADALSEKLNIPVCENALRKCESSVAQHELTASQRRINASRLFSAGDADLANKTVIIVDDVMTTGSTLNACASILMNMGAKSVIVASATTTV